MPQLIRIAGKSELPPPGETREFDAGGTTICVVNDDGEISALDNQCLHRGAPLGQGGVVAEGRLICPWHAWAWNPRTGVCGHDPEIRLRVYPVRIEGNDVMVEI
jgi:nitrite reductase (NADH) small subunit